MVCDSTEHRGRSNARDATLIGILPSFWRRGAGSLCFVLWWKFKMACHSNGFRRHAHLQATINISCWHKAFVFYMVWRKSPMASHGRTLTKALCCSEWSRMSLSGSWISFEYKRIDISCWHQAFVFYMVWWKSPMANHGRTLTKALCYREWSRMSLSGSWISVEYKRMIKSKFRASNTLLNSAKYVITRKSILVSLPKHLAKTQQQWRTQILPLQ